MVLTACSAEQGKDKHMSAPAIQCLHRRACVGLLLQFSYISKSSSRWHGRALGHLPTVMEQDGRAAAVDTSLPPGPMCWSLT